MINNENEMIARFLKFHAAGADKLQINFTWHNYYCKISLANRFRAC